MNFSGGCDEALLGIRMSGGLVLGHACLWASRQCTWTLMVVVPGERTFGTSEGLLGCQQWLQWQANPQALKWHAQVPRSSGRVYKWLLAVVVAGWLGPSSGLWKACTGASGGRWGRSVPRPL